MLVGCSGRDGQPSVHSGGNFVEILLEVQPKQWCRIAQPVRITDTLVQLDEKRMENKRLMLRLLRHNCVTCSTRHNESEKRLPKSCLVVLCKFEPVLHWTKECDNLLYQTLVEILIPDVLRPIPSELMKPAKSVTWSWMSFISGVFIELSCVLKYESEMICCEVEEIFSCKRVK